MAIGNALNNQLGKLINVQYLTSSSGTYTPTTGTQSCYVICIGGGGGGAGTNASGNGASSSGAGGGGCAMKFYSNASALSGSSYAVGAGGIGVAPGSAGSSGQEAIGNTGGTSSFYNGDITANGGTGGIQQIGSNTNTSSRSGGSASATGGLAIPGAPGFPSSTVTGVPSFPFGGNSGYGNGGGAIGANGVYGGGAGGLGANVNPGKNGGDGIIIVYEYGN